MKDDLQNIRCINLKDWLPTTCDAITVGMMKHDILDSSTMYQIGGQKIHRTLFFVAMLTAIGQGLIFQLYDIQKFFDKEVLRDDMNCLHDIRVEP